MSLLEFELAYKNDQEQADFFNEDNHSSDSFFKDGDSLKKSILIDQDE